MKALAAELQHNILFNMLTTRMWAKICIFGLYSHSLMAVIQTLTASLEARPTCGHTGNGK